MKPHGNGFRTFLGELAETGECCIARLSHRWYVGGMIVGGLGVPCSLYYASYAVWLNAHPLYDDKSWEQQFYIAAVAFLLSLFVAIGGAIGVVARRKVT